MSRPDGYFGVSGRPYWYGTYGLHLLLTQDQM